MIYLSPSCHEYYRNNSLCPLVEHGSSHKISLKKMKQQTTETDLEHHHDAACLQKFTSDLPTMVDWNFSTAFFCVFVPENEVFFSEEVERIETSEAHKIPIPHCCHFQDFLFFGSWSWKTPIPHTIHGTGIFAYILPLKKLTIACRQIYRSHGFCGWIDSRTSILSTWPMVPPFFETDPEPWLWAKMAGMIGYPIGSMGQTVYLPTCMGNLYGKCR